MLLRMIDPNKFDFGAFTGRISEAEIKVLKEQYKNYPTNLYDSSPIRCGCSCGLWSFAPINDEFASVMAPEDLFIEVVEQGDRY